MKYIVAVSGGVDSVVLLDMLKKSGEHELIVAHFDHGIRPESACDAEFVRALTDRYGLRCEVRREELGPKVSEEAARTRRYMFLREVAAKEGATIVTAHHRDDVIETIVINLTRGTGWRGLAVLGDATIERPLLRKSKQEIYEYATKQGLEWVEDETNATDAYLRNRVRRNAAQLDEKKRQRVLELWAAQRELARAIDDEVLRLGTTSRYFMTMIDQASALELLRGELAENSVSLTRPQRTRLLHAIKTAHPRSTYEAGSDTNITFTKREFIVKHPL